MTKHVMLNNIAHKDLRVITRHSAEYGENVGTVLTFPTEFGDVLREYPIFFRKDPQTDEYQSIALLGFAKDENLFLDENGWNASYVPGIIARGPFLIGRGPTANDGGEAGEEMTIHVDMDDPRISRTEGEPVFLPQGGNTHYLERIASILNGLHQGIGVSKRMFAAFAEYDLIEPVNVEIKLNNEEKYSLLGLHTISEEKLQKLDADALLKLHRAGFLQGAYLVLASLTNVKRLIDLKQQRLLKAGAPPVTPPPVAGG